MSNESKKEANALVITAGSGALKNLKVLNPNLKVVFEKGGA